MFASMNMASPASSQPIRLRGWWPTTTRPTAAVTTMITIRPAADHRCAAENVPISTADRTMKAVSATITAASTTAPSLGLKRNRAVAEVTARPRGGSSMARTLRPERSGNVTAGTAGGGAGAGTGAVRDYDGRDRCGRIAVDGT